MCDTAAAHVADFVFVGFACGTCGRDHLHKRWFIIFLVNVAGLHAIGKVDGTIFRAEGKSHGQTDTFACNSSFTIDAFTVFRAVLYNIVGNGFDIMDPSVDSNPILAISVKIFRRICFTGVSRFRIDVLLYKIN